MRAEVARPVARVEGVAFVEVLVLVATACRHPFKVDARRFAGSVLLKPARALLAYDAWLESLRLIKTEIAVFTLPRAGG